MTTRKAREFWINVMPEGYVGWVSLTKENATHVREVLPDPTYSDIEKLFIKSEYSGHYISFELGFRAALKYMKGESE